MLRLFCGNLHFDTTEDTLTRFFSDSGFSPTKVHIIREQETNRSRGFGFVELNTPQEAQDAIAAMHQQKLQGRTVIVNAARPKPVRESQD